MLAPRRWKLGLWITPIVLVVCALMVLPAGALTSAHGTRSPSGAAPTVTPASGAASPSALETRYASLGAPPPGATTLSRQSVGLGAPGTRLVPSISGAPGLSRLASSLPLSNVSPSLTSSASAAQQVLGLVRSGSLPANVAYLPSSRLFPGALSSPSQVVSPSYNRTPAPMGLADLGLRASGAYAVYTPEVQGSVTLVGYNASGGSLYEDTGGLFAGRSPNAALTPWQSGLQLNTVVTNVSDPTSNTGVFWTQNVLDVSGSTLQFIDNIWNFSSPGARLGNGTISSGNGTVAQGLFYYDYGPSIPLSFPVSIDLYNTVANVLGRTTVSFGYTITEGATVYQGIYDTVAFTSDPSLPLLAPSNLIDGKAFTPAGALYDAELVLGGPGAGSNAVVQSLNGTMSLRYRNATGWLPSPAAYSYGADTGETAIGVAGTWAATGVEHVLQGPSMTYGLWNTTAGVPAGHINVNLVLQPIYGLVFIGPPSTNDYNLSWAPTTAGGQLVTELPPLPTYDLTAFADGFDQTNQTLTGNTIGSLSLASSLSPVWNAPIYMNGNAQAAALGADTGTWSGTGPISFSHFEVDVNLTFNQLNDYGYPEFDLFWANGVSSYALSVDNVSQGPDVHLFPAPFTIYYTVYHEYGRQRTLPNLGDQFAVWGGVNDVFSNLSLVGIAPTPNSTPLGGAVSLWHSAGVRVTDVTATNDTFGVWAASSDGLVMTDSSVDLGFSVLALADSSNALVTNLSAVGSLAAVFAMGGSANHFVGLNADSGFTGLYDLSSNSSTVNYLNASYGAKGAYLANTSGVEITNSRLTGSSTIGVLAVNSDRVLVQDLVANNGSTGAVLLGGNYSTTTQILANDYSTGVLVVFANNTTVRGVSALNGSRSTLLFGANYTSLSSVSARNLSTGLLAQGSNHTSVSGLTAALSSAGALGSELSFTSFDGVTVSLGSDGVLLAHAVNTTVTNLLANDSTGFEASVSNNTSVSSVTAENFSIGVELLGSLRGTVSGVTANGSEGVAAVGSSDISVSEVRATNQSLAVLGVGDESCWVNATSATTGSMAVDLVSTDAVHVVGVSATAAVSGGASYNYVGLPPVVATVRTTSTTLSSIRSTGYPVALVDVDSVDLAVQTLNASWGEYGLRLNGTYGGLFSGIAAYHDGVGLLMNDNAGANVVSMSSFVDCTSFGVMIASGSGNLVYDNSFVGNNGATSSYNATHVQAYSDGAFNSFSSPSGIGNYWADWHTYSHGVLAPYYVGNGAWDFHPLGAPEGMFLVTFQEAGLAPGISWSVTFNGQTESSQGSSLSFAAYPGSYAFTVGGATGWQIGIPSGTVVVSNAGLNVSIPFSALVEVELLQSGLASGASWSAIVGGQMETGQGSALLFFVPAGASYLYQVVPVAGYEVSPASGTVPVGSATYTVAVTFRAVVYPVTFSETGLSPGTVWTVTVDGVAHATSGDAVTVDLPNGSFSYSFANVTGASVSAGRGSGTVDGSATGVAVSYVPTHPPVYVQVTTFDELWGLGLAIAVIALVVGLVAWRAHRQRPPMRRDPVAPAPSASVATPAAGSASGPKADWSEESSSGSPK